MRCAEWEELKEKPYEVEDLDFEFFLNYSSLNYLKSIRPGKKKGDSVVTDIKSIQYNPDGRVKVKFGFKENYTDLPQRIKTPSSKYVHLQELKSVLQKDIHDFYDSLSHSCTDPCNCKKNRTIRSLLVK